MKAVPCWQSKRFMSTLLLDHRLCKLTSPLLARVCFVTSCCTLFPCLCEDSIHLTGRDGIPTYATGKDLYDTRKSNATRCCRS